MLVCYLTLLLVSNSLRPIASAGNPVFFLSSPLKCRDVQSGCGFNGLLKNKSYRELRPLSSLFILIPFHLIDISGGL